MARFQQDADVEALGRALADLRHAAGLSQAEAGVAVGMTSQGWGLYEAGKRPGLFRPDVQRKLTAAVGASVEDLALIVARTPPHSGVRPLDQGVESSGRAYVGGTSATQSRTETWQLTDDALAPWASSGVVLEFDPGRWPRRDQGCVIDFVSGERRVRLYDHADTEALYVRDASVRQDGVERIARGDTRRVCAVVARHET